MNPRLHPWTDQELDDSILQLCQEFPDAPLSAYSRARESGRAVPMGTVASLLIAMRAYLRGDPALN